jgi:hypothetical protein
MWPLLLALGAPPLCIVQSDNRRNTMTQTSFASAHATNFTHLAYDCYGKGAAKPALLAHACAQCGHAVWIDSDVFVLKTFTPPVVLDLVRRSPANTLIVGTDYLAMIKEVRASNSHPYHNYFNTGAFVVDCNASRDLLLEWAHYARAASLEDDQTALQLMAAANSVYHRRIQYDFKVFGVHSAYMRHYPGVHRHKFAKAHPPPHTPIPTLPCPLR